LTPEARASEMRWGACFRRKQDALFIFEPAGMPTANEADEMIFVLS
jgi:hypothetical protein